MFARTPKTIEDLLPDTTTKDHISIEERKKFIEEQFADIKEEVRRYTNEADESEFISCRE